MNDFSKLKSYLNENSRGSSNNLIDSSNSLNDIKNSIFTFFNKNSNNEQRNLNSEDQAESWFSKDSIENDPYCPKLVCALLFISF